MRNKIQIIATIILSNVLIFSISCKKNDTDLLAATSIELVSGDNQSAQIETALTNPIEVIIKDQNGNAFKDASITFAVSEGSVSAATAATDTNGKATTNWTLGTTVGSQTLTVTALKSDGITALTGSPITISATASAKPLIATSIELVSGADQTAEVEKALTTPIKIIVKDQNGNALNGATVNFTPTQGSATTLQTTTNATGNANTTWTLGSIIGSQSLVITAFKEDGTTVLTNSPITVSATATAPTNVTDIEGNIYDVVTIGNQIWMAENLKVTKYPNNTSIPLISNNTAWDALEDNNTDDAYCWYDDDINNKDVYGALYNYAAAMGDNAVSSNTNPSGVQGVCPTGWHIPSQAEWNELTSFLIADGQGYGGSGDDIGKAMAYTSGWENASTYGRIGNDQTSNNSSGFAGKPGGYRRWSGEFYSNTREAYFMSATEDESEVYQLFLNYGTATVSLEERMKSQGASVRCVRD